MKKSTALSAMGERETHTITFKDSRYKSLMMQEVVYAENKTAGYDQ